MRVRAGVAVATAVALFVSGCGEDRPSGAGLDSEPTSAPAINDATTFALAEDGNALVVGGLGAGESTEIALWQDGTWTSVGDTPFGNHPLNGVSVTRTGTQFVVVATTCDVIQRDDAYDRCEPGEVIAATFDPDSGDWAVIDPPDLSGPSTATYLMSSNQASTVLEASDGLHVLDHTDLTWAALPLETGESPAEACVVDDQMVTLRGHAERPVGRIYSRDTGTWGSDLPSPFSEDRQHQAWSYACGPEGVWAISLLGEPLAFELTSSGVFEARPHPGPGFSGAVQSARSDAGFVIASQAGELVVYDAAAGRWGPVTLTEKVIADLAWVDPGRALVALRPPDQPDGALTMITTGT